MKSSPPNAPTAADLWAGAVQASVVHGIMMVRYPDLAHEQSWDGWNYSVQDSSRSRGTVSFDPDNVHRLVGVFCDSESLREDSSWGLAHLLVGIPADLLEFAQTEALQYVLDSDNGHVGPVITAAFWSPEGRLLAAEPWEDAMRHGAHLIARQLLDRETAFDEWQSYFDMAPWHLELARELLAEKVARPRAIIQVASAWKERLRLDGPGAEVARRCLADLGIRWT